ncbi:cilia- and flagella-associated protein 70 [Hylaeus volcanicus]|uniref:cilia- and flagella-associated protein 70 n=1 Tax=Hylaeus volcanicus TaxID=313075 RepID=UPI0023B7A213|nr:cilia- and flagella-associated protein 70 [Hylaeus volcanicus]
MEQSSDENKIEININSIENIIRKDDISVTLIVEHSGTVLGESTPVSVKATCEEESAVYNIDFVVYLSIIANDRKSLDSIVSTPVLIKVEYETENKEEEQSSVLNTEIKKKSIFTAKAAPISSSRSLGSCNLDLIPIVLGEQCFTEKLILETPQFSYDGALVPWQDLPLLTVKVSQSGVPLIQTNENINFLNVTVESIYNLPESFAENLEYKAGTIAYVDGEVPEKLIFDHGKWTGFRDVERTKRWNSLNNVENRARLSKYKLDCDFMGVKNMFKKQIDLAKKVCEDAPRIEWNVVNRCIIWKTGIEAMRNHITKYKYWPFQFMLIERSSSAKSKASPSPKSQLYQCYVDLSELIFPGKRSCRVVGQLYTYNATDITETVGLEDNIFVLETRVRESKDREKKHKTSKHSQSGQSDILGREVEVPSSIALSSQSGEPTIIVVEVELYQPLVACRIMRDFSNIMEDLIPKTEKKPPYVYTSDVAEEQYMNCIQKLAEIITESYRDELTCFTQYLYKTGVYLSLRNTLRTKVTMLLDQRFKMPSNLVDSNQTQNFIASVYTYLVEQMHVAINKIVEGRNAEDLPHVVNLELSYFYAEEAYELGDLHKARRYYTTAITANKNNPEPWTKYAIFLKKIGDIERSKQCCLEALALNRQYVFALLIYAIILYEDRDYEEAEIFLKAITDFYPRFFEGWVILHLFYMQTEYYPGVDLTLRVAEKCIKDKNRTIQLTEEPHAWSMYHCPEHNVYMMTAVFLLKLHLCEFAGFALAEEMSNSNQTIHFLYYMAVEHYLSGRFEDALSHLEEVKCTYGMDYSISSLMGHCYFKLGDDEKAMECYEFTRMLFDRPNDLHLVEVRLGYHCYKIGDYDRAKRIFLSACKSSPTSQTWLGAGISCYELNEFQEAEMALSEANQIDNCNPDIWGYLCLLNMSLERYDEFCQCYREMIKYQNNLKNIKLWLRITNLMEALDYAPPLLVTEFDNLIEDYSREAFEEQF